MAIVSPIEVTLLECALLAEIISPLHQRMGRLLFPQACATGGVLTTPASTDRQAKALAIANYAPFFG